MAQKKLVSVNLAGIKEIEALAKALDKEASFGIAQAQKALEIAKTINPLLSKARETYAGFTKYNAQGYELYKELQSKFKEIGIDMPVDLANKIEDINKKTQLYGSKITSLMLDAKNVIDNRY